MLVESSDDKIPPDDALGTSQDLLERDSAGTGYVSRNVRLSLLSAELVEPYAAVTGVNELSLEDDLVPLADRSGRSCRKAGAVSVPAGSRKVVVQWSVGGALTVNDTRVWVARWADVPADKLDCLSQPDRKDVESLFLSGTPISSTQGTGRFHPGDVAQAPFSASLDISEFSAGDELVVIASARADQNWVSGARGDKVRPVVAPQSHVVNARTNASWHYENDDGKVVQGRLDWFSSPLTIVLREDGDKSGDPVAAELSSRYGNLTSPAAAVPAKGSTGQSADAARGAGLGVGAIALVAAAAVVAAAFGGSYLRHRMRRARRSRVRELIGEEEAAAAGAGGAKRESHGRANGYTDVPDDRGVELT
jgi:hypothetical protein